MASKWACVPKHVGGLARLREDEGLGLCVAIRAGFVADGGAAEWSVAALVCTGGSWAQECEVQATSRSDRGHCDALRAQFRDSKLHFLCCWEFGGPEGGCPGCWVLQRLGVARYRYPGRYRN